MCWMGRRQVGWKSTSLCDILLPLLSTAFDSPRTHPCSRIWTVDHSFLARQHRQAEEYASLRYPLSPLAGTVNLLLFATTRTGTPDLHARSHPCSRIEAMVHSFLTQQHPQAEDTLHGDDADCATLQRAPAPPNPAQEFRLLADPLSHSRTNRN